MLKVVKITIFEGIMHYPYIDNEDLTLRQRLFCHHYLINGYNATQAAISAGYKKHSARFTGSDNLQKPNVKKFLKEHMKETFEKVGMSLEYIASKLKTGLDLSIPDINANDDAEEKMLKAKTLNIKDGIACVAEYNKMCGHYAPEKQEITETQSIEVISKTEELTEKYEKDH